MEGELGYGDLGLGGYGDLGLGATLRSKNS